MTLPNVQVSSVLINKIKQRAKKIKREQKIPYHEALDEASREYRFSSFKHLQNNKPLALVAKPAVMKIIPHSESVVIPSGAIFRGRFLQPNLKMSLLDHKRVATLLKEILAYVHFRKSVSKPIDGIKNELDDWIQREYPGSEMSDEFFHSLYYGGQEHHMKISITDAESLMLIKKMDDVRKILTSVYPPCAPLNRLLIRLERAKGHLKTWSMRPPVVEKERTRWRKDTAIKSGTIVQFKSGRGDRSAVILRHDVYRGSVDYYSPTGKGTCARWGVNVPKTPVKGEYWPLRLYLPYGKWNLEDGTEVLYNRDYNPIWWRSTDGKVWTKAPEWVNDIKSHMKGGYFNDGNPPWSDSKSKLLCEQVLREWGVDGKKPEVLQMMHDFIAGGPSHPSFIDRG